MHEMKRFNVNQLNDVIVNTWKNWVHSAITSGVEGWYNNTFLKENVTIVIFVQYGFECVKKKQSTEIEFTIHKYSGIMEVDHICIRNTYPVDFYFRAATISNNINSRSIPVIQWKSIADNILEIHGEDIFDSAASGVHKCIVLQDLPLLDEDGLEM